MKLPDLSLYVVLDPVLCGGLQGMVETAAAAAAGGAGLVQLRAPGVKKGPLAECARAIARILRPTPCAFIIDDHADIARAVQADGLHIGQQDLSVSDARTIIGKEAILGLSITHLSQMNRSDWGDIDYIGIGPVWSTSTKPDADPATGLQGLAEIRAASPVPAVAIGGIHLPQVAPVIACGVEGIAVVSAVCGKPDPQASACELVRAIDMAKSERSRRNA